MSFIIYQLLLTGQCRVWLSLDFHQMDHDQVICTDQQTGVQCYEHLQ